MNNNDATTDGVKDGESGKFGDNGSANSNEDKQEKLNQDQTSNNVSSVQEKKNVNAHVAVVKSTNPTTRIGYTLTNRGIMSSLLFPSSNNNNNSSKINEKEGKTTVPTDAFLPLRRERLDDDDDEEDNFFQVGVLANLLQKAAIANKIVLSKKPNETGQHQ